MRHARCFAFGPFRLDVLDERLWKAQTSIPLGRKALTVLARLVTHPNQLATKDELLAAAWPETAVTEAVLTTAVREIRGALGDSARAPRFIQTVYGRGYRFVAPVDDISDRVRTRPAPVGPRTREDSAAIHHARIAGGDLVGRDEAWGRLEEWYASVEQSRRRIGLIAGEAGIGKTALVDAFVEKVAATSAVYVCRGQCIEQYGAGEAYLPILDALGRLGRDPAVRLAGVLRRHAPSWLVHLPSLASQQAEPSALVRPAQMLRELTEALEALALDTPLVLVLEDLHWSDTATLEWLGYVARRRETARLLVLATYRPVDALVQTAVLRDALAELRHQTQTDEIRLDALPRDAVRTYLRRRCAALPGLDGLAKLLHQRTGGHPLFLSSLVDELLGSSQTEPAGRADVDPHATARTIPVNVRQFIEHQFAQVSKADLTVLDAASVAGDPFSVAAVAAACGLPEDRVEARCAAWTRLPHFLTGDGLGAWPDGTLAPRYRFRHDLFRETAYGRISSERRARLHHRIGSRLEEAYGPQVSSIATELALHFEQGRDLDKAVAYLEQAAGNAIGRSAYAEAHRHLVRALEILDTLPQERTRLQRQATLMLLLAQVLEATEGWAAEGVARAYARARELCVALGDAPRVLKATWGVLAVSTVRAELVQAQALAHDLLLLVKKHQVANFRMVAHAWLGGPALLLGQTRSARRHFRIAEALYDPREHRALVATFGMDIGVFVRAWATHLMWYEGAPERARACAEQALRMAEETRHPFTRTIALAYAAMLSQFLRDLDAVDRFAAATIAHATEHGFPYYLAWAQVLRGWSRAARGADEDALADMRRGIDVMRTTAGVRLPYYRVLLAETCGRFGRIDEGLDAVAAAFHDVETSGERWCEPELHRMRGHLLQFARGTDADVERCFRTAIDIARRQEAASLQLRATVSLARLWQQQDRPGPAHLLLAPMYARFTEGFDIPDLSEARALLDVLEPRVSESHGPVRA